MEKLFKIGEVSSICNISIKTLRYYEELGIIKPVEIDRFTGYRYYDAENIKNLKKVLLLKDLNFSLQQIKDFNNYSLIDKKLEIESQIKELEKKLKTISSLRIEKGEIVMKEFENDNKVIGKWQYEFSATTKENYLKGDCYFDKNAMLQELYFLPEGKGYWMFDGWTKGKLFLHRGPVYTYEICDDKLILNVTHDKTGEHALTLVYKKVDSKEHVVEDIARKDFVDYPFDMDEEVLGDWEVYDFVYEDDFKNYKPQKSARNLYIKKMTFQSDGVVWFEDKYGNRFDKNWTKEHILTEVTDEHYQITEDAGEKFLILEWKSSEYTFTGKLYVRYVMKKIK